MRKFWLLILLFLFVVAKPVDARMIVSLTGGGAALACDGQGAGADQICEDWPGTGYTECFTGHPSTCRFAWDDVTTNGSGAVDFDSTRSATSCSDQGDYVLDINAPDCSTDNAVIYETFTGADITYTYFQVYFETLSGWDGSNYIRLAYGTTTGGSGAWSIYISYYNSAIRWELYDTQNSISDQSDSTISTSQWYEVLVIHDNTSDDIELKVATLGGSLTQEAYTSGAAITRQVGRLYLGVGNTSCDSSDSIRVQFGVVLVDNTSEVTTCN